MSSKIKQELNDFDDIIELDETSEYVQVSNAFTSPLSISLNQKSHQNRNLIKKEISPATFSNNNEKKIKCNNLQEIASLKPDTHDLKYVTLKDRLELDKTLSKYRSEINEIINKSSVNKNKEPSVYNKYLGSDDFTTNYPDIVYTGTFSNKLNNKNLNESFSNAVTKNENMELVKILTKDISKNNDQTNFNNLRKRNNQKIDHLSTFTYLNPIKDQKPSSMIYNLLKNFFSMISKLGIMLSRLLPYLIIIFFTIIILQYIRMKFFYNINQSEVNKAIILNDQKNQNKINHFYCDDIKNLDCLQTKLMIKDLIDYLRYKSGQIECSETNKIENSPQINNKPVQFIEKCVHITKISKYLVEKNLISDEKHKQEAINSMIKALLKNSNWQLRLLNGSYDETNDISQVTYIMSAVSSKTITCRARELLHFLYVRMLVISFVVIMLLLIYLIYKTIIKNRLEYERTFFSLVNKVTNMVERHYELSLVDPANIKPYIAISHIHDTIFDPSVRILNRKLWNNVVKFIEDHESRIHLMTEFIDGEETHVWKWVVPKHLQNISTSNFDKKSMEDGIGLANSTMISKDLLNNQNDNSNNFNKKCENENTHVLTQNNNGWQGDAFNRSERLIHSPTPCLKIRNMFDISDINNDIMLTTRIYNDILEKFNNNNFFKNESFNYSILHISCDKKSKEGCVYIKCNSNEAAGKIYQALNGTWYNGKLLNVKFLRSDRYVERFPDSINFNKPLQKIKVKNV